MSRLVLRYDWLLSSSRRVMALYEAASDNLDRVQRDYDSAIAEFGVAVQRRSDLEAGIRTLLGLMDKFSSCQLDAVRVMVNSALSAVFYDRDYQVKFVVSDKRKSKSMEMLLVETFPDGVVIESNIKDSIGGGVRTVIGLSLRVYFMCYFRVARVLFVDEGLVRVSANYMDRLLMLLKRMSLEMGFIFVVITHDDQVMSYADALYTIANGYAVSREVTGKPVLCGT